MALAFRHSRAGGNPVRRCKTGFGPRSWTFFKRDAKGLRCFKVKRAETALFQNFTAYRIALVSPRSVVPVLRTSFS